MIINYHNRESSNGNDWHIERINADKVEFSFLNDAVIVNEGERVLSLVDVISITDKAKSRKG